LLALAKAGVEVVDLLPAFLAARRQRPDELIFQRQDTHWTDSGLRLAADIISERVKKYPWYKELARHAQRFTTREASFQRLGDLHSRLPDAAKSRYEPEKLNAQQVIAANGDVYVDDADSPIVVLGDSFTGVYELMDAEHAGLSAHIAKDVAYPVDLVMSYGGGPNVRNKLMRRGAAALGSKKLVVWVMTARDLYNYWEDWEPLERK
jgi:alginate O-acetyltransferase complex protein AlgJ